MSLAQERAVLLRGDAPRDLVVETASGSAFPVDPANLDAPASQVLTDCRARNIEVGLHNASLNLACSNLHQQNAWAWARTRKDSVSLMHEHGQARSDSACCTGPNPALLDYSSASIHINSR